MNLIRKIQSFATAKKEALRSSSSLSKLSREEQIHIFTDAARKANSEQRELFKKAGVNLRTR